MMAKSIIKSDQFLEMPMSSQLLYFHLLSDADDDGFINAPKSIMRVIGAKEDDMRVLQAKGYTIPFDSGVIIIKHWRIHNTLRKDRYNPNPQLENERKQLVINDRKEYELATTWQPLGKHLATTGYHSIGKDSIGKDSIGKTTTTETKKIKVIEKDVDVVDDELSKIAKLYLENGFGQASGYTAELLKQALHEYSFAWCQKALQLTVEQGGKSWRYTQAILENWKSKYDITAKPWEVENEHHKKGNRKDETEPTDWSSMPTDRW